MKALVRSCFSYLFEKFNYLRLTLPDPISNEFIFSNEEKKSRNYVAN